MLYDALGANRGACRITTVHLASPKPGDLPEGQSCFIHGRPERLKSESVLESCDPVDREQLPLLTNKIGIQEPFADQYR